VVVKHIIWMRAFEIMQSLRSLALFFWSSSLVIGFGDCLDISPIPESGPIQYEEDGGTTSGGNYSYVDVSGLLQVVGLESEWKALETIEIQLLETSPIWTIHNLHPSNSNSISTTITSNDGQLFWAGESEDGLITGNFALYTSPESGISAFVGRVDDLKAGVFYQLKPNANGEDTVSVHEIDEYEKRKKPSSSREYENLTNPSYWDIWNALGISGLAKELVWNPILAANERGWLRKYEEDTKVVTIDVMVVWSVNAECAESFLPNDCALNETTHLNMMAATENMVSISNLVHENSQTGVRLSLVHAERDQSGYRESSSVQALTDLALPLVDGKLNYIQSLRYVYHPNIVNQQMRSFSLSLMALPCIMTPHRNKKKADLVTYIYDNRLDSDRNCGVGNLHKAPGLPLPAFPLSCLGYSVVGAYCMFGYTAVHEVRIRRIGFFSNPIVLFVFHDSTMCQTNGSSFSGATTWYAHWTLLPF